jgi:hypothetical protein
VMGHEILSSFPGWAKFIFTSGLPQQLFYDRSLPSMVKDWNYRIIEIFVSKFIFRWIFIDEFVVSNMNMAIRDVPIRNVFALE